MPLSDMLEDFSEAPARAATGLTDVMLEEEKLQAFEKGYQAGWDDSTKAQQQSAAHLSEDFARNIRDLSFTYQEACTAVIGAMEPLVREIVTSVLPDLAHETLAVRVAELLQHEVAAHGALPVTIVTAPGHGAALEAILPNDATLPLDIREDSTLADGQVQLRLGDAVERDIDLTGVLAGIGTAVEGFFQQAEQTVKERA
ncbi:MAG: flagellar biosynthesis protein [Roseovarius sp.]